MKQAITSMVLRPQVFNYTADLDSLVDRSLTYAQGAMKWVGGQLVGWMAGWMSE